MAIITIHELLEHEEKDFVEVGRYLIKNYVDGGVPQFIAELQESKLHIDLTLLTKYRDDARGYGAFKDSPLINYLAWNPEKLRRLLDNKENDYVDYLLHAYTTSSKLGEEVVYIMILLYLSRAFHSDAVTMNELIQHVSHIHPYISLNLKLQIQNYLEQHREDSMISLLQDNSFIKRRELLYLVESFAWDDFVIALNCAALEACICSTFRVEIPQENHKTESYTYALQKLIAEGQALSAAGSNITLGDVVTCAPYSGALRYEFNKIRMKAKEKI